MKKSMLFQVAKHVSLDAYSQAPDHIERLVSNDLRMQLAAHIGKTGVTKSERPNHIEFRLELIVATVDEFFAEVQKYAEAAQHRRPLFLEPRGPEEM